MPAEALLSPDVVEFLDRLAEPRFHEVMRAIDAIERDPSVDAGQRFEAKSGMASPVIVDLSVAGYIVVYRLINQGVQIVLVDEVHARESES